MKFRDWIMKRNPIFGSNWQRIGLLRIIPAALAMYATIPAYIFLHIICIKLLYNSVLCPLLRVEPINLKNYIVFDRHIISELSFTGRFHCAYCEYANGLCVATGALLTRISTEAKAPANPLISFITLPLYLFTSLLTALTQSISNFFYNIVMAPLLGLHTVSVGKSYAIMREAGFGNRFTAFGKISRSFLRFENSSTLILANSLEQVESQWCPIKHLDTPPETVLPEHHAFFIDRCDLCKMRKVLCTEGSVSPRKPTW